MIAAAAQPRLIGRRSRCVQRIAVPALSVRLVAARRGRLRTRSGGILGAEADIATGRSHALVTRCEIAGPGANLVGEDEAPWIVLGARRGGGRHGARRNETSEDELSDRPAHGASPDGCSRR